MAFVPRSTAPTGSALATYWTAFTGECVWYSIGRIREVADTPTTDPNRAWPVTLSSIQVAKQIYPYADETNGWIRDGYSPSLGAIECWDGVAGHCMNVEAIIDDVVYMSGYNFPNYHSFSYLSYTISEIVNGIPGLGTFQGFVRNPYVGPTPPVQKTPRLSITPSSGIIGLGGLEVEIEIEYVPGNDGLLPVSIVTSSGLSMSVVIDWQMETYTESGFSYKRGYRKVRLTASSSTPSPATMRLYRSYTTGTIDKTGTYVIDIGNNLIPIFEKILRRKKLRKTIVI